MAIIIHQKQLIEIGRVSDSGAVTARAYWRDDRHPSGMTAAAYALRRLDVLPRGEARKFAALPGDREAIAAANRVIELDRRIEALHRALGEALDAADALLPTSGDFCEQALAAFEAPESPEVALLRQLIERAGRQLDEALTASQPPADLLNEQMSGKWAEWQIIA